MIFSHKWFMKGVYTFKGGLTNESIGRKFGLKYKNLELLLAARVWIFHSSMLLPLGQHNFIIANKSYLGIAAHHLSITIANCYEICHIVADFIFFQIYHNRYIRSLRNATRISCHYYWTNMHYHLAEYICLLLRHQDCLIWLAQANSFLNQCYT